MTKGVAWGFDFATALPALLVGTVACEDGSATGSGLRAPPVSVDAGTSVTSSCPTGCDPKYAFTHFFAHASVDPQWMAVGADGSVDLGVVLDQNVEFFDEATSTTTVASVPADSYERCIVKLSPAGQFAWLHVMETIPYNPSGVRPLMLFNTLSVAAGPDGSVVYVLGDKIVKLATDGTELWSKAVTGSLAAQAGGAQIYGVTVDESGAVYFTGQFTSPAYFDPGPGATPTPANQQGIFLAKWTGNGDFAWVQLFPSLRGSGNFVRVASGGRGVAVGGELQDASGNSGPFMMRTDDAPSASASPTWLKPVGTRTDFWAMTSDGELVSWTAIPIFTEYDLATGEAGWTFEDNHWSVTRFATGPNRVALVGSRAVVPVGSSWSTADELAALSNEGKLLWMLPSSPNAHVVAVDRNGAVWVAGYTTAPTNFDPLSGQDRKDPGGNGAAYVTKFDPP